MCVCVCVCVCWVCCVCTTSTDDVTECFLHSPEVVNAQAKVSGEHAILFKYLNPHLIAIATESENSERCKQNCSTYCVTIYLSFEHVYFCHISASIDIYTIDVVSGHFVSHIYHRQHRSPVHMVLSENWLLVNIILCFVCRQNYCLLFVCIMYFVCSAVVLSL